MKLAPRGAACVLLAAAMILQACAHARPAPRPGEPQVFRGTASWYGQEFAGRATANGEIFDPLLLTAAHRTLPFGTVVEVTNVENGESVRVRINDRGPFVGDRVIDLSYAAAKQIGLIGPGTGIVEARIVGMEPASPRIARQLDPPPPEIDIPLPSPASPAAEPATARRVGFVVQLGSFHDEANARALQRRAQAWASQVWIEKAGEMNRVRVGTFATRADALAARDQLELSGFSGIVMEAAD